MCLMNLHDWEIVCSFPPTLFDLGALSVGANILWHPFWETLNQLVLAESLGISVLTSRFLTQRTRGWTWGQVAAQPSARLQCPPEKLVLLLQLLPWAGRLLTTSDTEEWKQFPVCVSPTTYPLCSPLPAIQGTCLVKLINLCNDAISLFFFFFFNNINVCSANLPLSVLPRKRGFTRGLFYELELAPLCGRMLWTLTLVWDMLRGEPGDSFMDFLNFQNDFTDSQMLHFGAVHITAMLNLTKGRVGIFCSFWGENEAHNVVHTSDSLAIQDKKHLLGWDPLILFSSARWYRAVGKRFEFISEIPPVARTPQPPPLCPEFGCRAWQIALT